MNNRSSSESINYQSLFELNTDAILIVDNIGYIKEGNLAVEEISGYSVEELKGTLFLDYIIEEQRILAKSRFHSAYEGIVREERYHFIKKNGKQISILTTFIPMNQMNQEMFLLIKDISFFDSLSDQYLESEMNLRIIAENVQDVIVLLDDKMHYLYISPSCVDMFGYSPKELKNKEQPFFNIHPDYIELLKQQYNESIVTGKYYKIILKALHEKRGWIWIEINGTPVFDKSQQFRHMVLVARDISMQKEKEDRLEFFAFHDSLTGLPNRRFIKKQMKDLIEKLNNEKKKFTVILLDIDDFKLINDHWGHETGDEVICEFARRIQQVVGDKGVAARLGGDEFIILLDNVTSKEDVKAFILNIQQQMVNEMKFEDQSISVTTSIGATICTTKNMTESYYIKSADVALYKVKEKGKNQYHILYS